MKKKLVSLLSLILVMAMVLPVMPIAVFASGDTETLYYNATTSEGKKTYQISHSQFTGAEAIVRWESTNTNVVTVSESGLVTAVGAGEAYVSAYDATNNQKINKKFTCISRTLQSIAVDPTSTSRFETDYYTGDVFDPTGMVIKATYDNGDVDSVATGYTYAPSGALNTSVKKITITYKDGNVEKTCEQTISVTELYVTKVQIINYEDEYTEGEKISGVRIKVTYNDDTTEEKDSSFTISNTNTLKTSDTSFYVTYRGVTSDAVSITVTEKKTETETNPPEPSNPEPEEITYSVALKSGSKPTKTTYTVGESFDPSGIELIIKKHTGNFTQDISNNTSVKESLVYIVPASFTTADIGTNKSVSIYVKFIYNNEEKFASLTITGLTVSDPTPPAPTVDETKIISVTSVTLKEEAYREGYEFTLADIEKIKVKFQGDSTSTTIMVEDFTKYSFTNYLELEVYNTSGNRKTSTTYRDKIRSEDIYEDDGDKLINMALRYKYYKNTSNPNAQGEYKFPIELGEDDVAYYYKTKYITDYEELEEALEYCIDDDAAEKWGTFELRQVDDDEYLLLKLGKSFSFSSSYYYTPEHNIVIDLNGNNLSLYTDTFEFDEREDFTITVKNTSSAESKLTYRDNDIVIVLEKGDSLTFEKDLKTAPGIYTVTAQYNTAHVTITADPKLTSNKAEIGKGGEIKFTVVPKTGFEITSVKAASKNVMTDKDNYAVNSNGVVVYTLKNVTKDTVFEVTLKEIKKEWDNPFSDVRSTAAYYSAVEFVYENELFKGTTNTTFSPSSTMTRAMFVTVLGRLSGLTDESAVRKYGYDSDFTDVSSSNGRIKYAVPYIKWAVDNGIVEGYGDGTFGPENEITHQQMYVMMYRYARFVENKTGSIGNVSLSMSDRSSVADWAADSVKYAQYHNYLVYTNTTKTRIDPTGEALRSELAMLLESFCQTVLGWSTGADA